MFVIIDNGHGRETPGKKSPDGRLREWLWTREMAVRVETALRARGVRCERIVKEERDVPLGERCRRANALYAKDRSAVLVSVHVNAAGGDRQWHSARGFCAMVGRTASSNSKRLARLIYEAASARGLAGNRCVPKEKYWVQGLYICQQTRCPAVLVECLFQDNREDVEVLLSEAGKTALCDAIVEGLVGYAKG